MLSRSAASRSRVYDHRVVDRTAGEHRPAPQLVFPHFLLLRPRMVGGEGDVDGDRHLRIEARCGDQRPAAVQPDLFLRRGHRDHARHSRRGGIAAQRFEHHEGADAIVDRARCNAVVGEVDRARVDHAGVADPDERRGLVARGRPDVDPEVGDLGRLLALVGLHQVDRLLPHHADHVSLPSGEADALPHEHLRVPPADRSDRYQTAIVDVGGDHADFVDVAGEHDRHRAGGIHFGEGVSDHVGGDAGEGRGLFAPDTRGGAFEAGRAGGVEEALEKRDGVFGEHENGTGDGGRGTGVRNLTTLGKGARGAVTLPPISFKPSLHQREHFSCAVGERRKELGIEQAGHDLDPIDQTRTGARGQRIAVHRRQPQ